MHVQRLSASIDALAAEHDFSGVVSVDRGGDIDFARAYGLADRTHQTPNTVDTRFGIASGTKGLTAVAVVTLIEHGVLDLATTARSVLGDDLPLIDAEVTIEHLLAHRSGIGDYLDEEAEHDLADYRLPIPVHRFGTTEGYLPVLDGRPTKFAPGLRFSYCNSGYVVLALIAERVSGQPFPDLVADRVCRPAGMPDTAFPRSDELPERTATGYLRVEDGRWRSNVLHLPVRGSGDGGAYATVADLSAFWRALFGDKLISGRWVAELVRPRSDVPEQSKRYGLGFWLYQGGDQVLLMGMDPGVSFISVHDPDSARTHTVVSNTSTGAWPIARHLRERFYG